MILWSAFSKNILHIQIAASFAHCTEFVSTVPTTNRIFQAVLWFTHHSRLRALCSPRLFEVFWLHVTDSRLSLFKSQFKCLGWEVVLRRFFVFFAYQSTSATLNFGGKNITRIESLSDMIGVGDLIKKLSIADISAFLQVIGKSSKSKKVHLGIIKILSISKILSNKLSWKHCSKNKKDSVSYPRRIWNRFWK